MTECDYSADAYERYLATQQRIARWTEETSRYRPSNPFVTSPTEDIASSLGSLTFKDSRSCSVQRSQTRHRSTPAATHPGPEPPSSYMGHTSVQGNSAEYFHSSTRSRSTHHHSSRSSTSRQTSGSSRKRATGSTAKLVSPSVDGPTYIKRSKPHSILIPIDFGRYVMIPRKGTRLEVLDTSHPHTLPYGNRMD